MVGTVGAYSPASLVVPETQAMQVMSPLFGAGSSTWRLLPSRWHGEYADKISDLKTVAQADWEVRPTEFERLSTGVVTASAYPLTECLRNSAPGATIRVNGVIPEPANRYQLGGGAAPLDAWGAFHVAVAEPLQVTIIGANLDGTDEIPAFEIWDNVAGIPAGITELRLQGLTIRNSNGAAAPIMGRIGEDVGTIRIFDCWLTGDDGDVAGFGMESAIDCRTRARWDLRRVELGFSPRDAGLSTAAPGSEEYAVKIDAPKENSSFTQCSMHRSWEGMFLIRAEGATNPGDSGQGILLFDRCTASNVWGNEEARHGHFHVQGHHGPVIFRDCASEQGTADAAGGFSRASILVAPPAKQAEWITDSNGWTTTRVVVINHRVGLPLASGNESHLIFHGVGNIDLHAWDFSGSDGAGVRNVDVSPSWIGAAADFSLPSLRFVIANPAEGIASVAPPVSNYLGWSDSSLLAFYADLPIPVDAAAYQALGANFLFPGVSFNQSNGQVSGTPLEGNYDPPVSGTYWVGAASGVGAGLTGELGAFVLTVEEFDGSFIATLPEIALSLALEQPIPVLEDEALMPTVNLEWYVETFRGVVSTPVPTVDIDLVIGELTAEVEIAQVMPQVSLELEATPPGVGQVVPAPAVNLSIETRSPLTGEISVPLPSIELGLRFRVPVPNQAASLPVVPLLLSTTAPNQEVGVLTVMPSIGLELDVTAPRYQIFPTIELLLTVAEPVPFAQIFIDKIIPRGRVGQPRPRRVDVGR